VAAGRQGRRPAGRADPGARCARLLTLTRLSATSHLTGSRRKPATRRDGAAAAVPASAQRCVRRPAGAIAAGSDRLPSASAPNRGESRQAAAWADRRYAVTEGAPASSREMALFRG
jgi:hypothetical protein